MNQYENIVVWSVASMDDHANTHAKLIHLHTQICLDEKYFYRRDMTDTGGY